MRIKFFDGANQYELAWAGTTEESNPNQFRNMKMGQVPPVVGSEVRVLSRWWTVDRIAYDYDVGEIHVRLARMQQ